MMRAAGFWRAVLVACFLGLLAGFTPQAGARQPGIGQPTTASTPANATPRPIKIRVATFNIQDVRTTDLVDGRSPRLRAIAEVIQRLRPNVILLNELAYDMPGAPGFKEGAAPGQNAARFIDLYLSRPQVEGLQPLEYEAYMPPTNTGVPSGLDLSRDGKVTTRVPPAPATQAGPDAPASNEQKEYAGDCWGYGTFPGQYGFALLVDKRLTLLADKVRTFQRYPWDYLPGALLPSKADGAPWFSQAEKDVVRLSSKNHCDVPVRLPNGAVVHFLCSHPTPPAFDAEEMKNKKRNHDEIRFWADYISGAYFIVDDRSVEGGLSDDASFVLLGDLNADPSRGQSFKNPIYNLLQSLKRLNFVSPLASEAREGLSPEDTARFKLRVDYVLPSVDLEVGASGIWRATPTLEKGENGFPSDHFPVWVDLTVPEPQAP